MAACEHRGDHGADLGARVRGTGAHPPLDQRRQAQTVHQRARQDQARVGHQALMIEPSLRTGPDCAMMQTQKVPPVFETNVTFEHHNRRRSGGLFRGRGNPHTPTTPVDSGLVLGCLLGGSARRGLTVLSPPAQRQPCVELPGLARPARKCHVHAEMKSRGAGAWGNETSELVRGATAGSRCGGVAGGSVRRQRDLCRTAL